MYDFCVIGSGPSAVSAAVALTRRGLQVRMLDAGREIEPDRSELVSELATQSPAEWNPQALSRLKDGVEVTSKGIPLKSLYGSDFAFRTEGSGVKFEYVNAGVRPSFARGGLSNVWGAGIQPFEAADMGGWPIDAAELEPFYGEVFSFMPHTRAMPRSKQAQGILAAAERSKTKLREAGIEVAAAQLAVDAARCAQCGLCLYGCPYGLVYNSSFTLRELMALPNFHYESGFVVERLEETGGSVRVIGRGREVACRRVLLGAGVIPSTAILLASLGHYGEPIRLQDSFYFLLPLLRFEGVKDVQHERLHTLAQAFISLREERVHFSVYGFNDLMIPALKESAGPLGGLPEFYSRAMVAGGYLDSRESPGLTMTVQLGHVRIEGEDATAAMELAKKAAGKLMRHAFPLRMVALSRGIRFFPPGRGFHTGGSFPMRRVRERHTSDIEGRPFGFERVHLVDASCLPSIPANTITLPVMANAFRIASVAGDRA